MSLVDWSKIPTEYQWATVDEDGVWVHTEQPGWAAAYNGFYSNVDAFRISGTTLGKPAVEQRPINKAGDPPAIISVIKETLDLLDYLAFEAGQRPSPEDRLKIVDHMRALSKALKEWENY